MIEVIKDSLLEKLKENIIQSLGDNLKRILLFGSRARGDFYADSDYDILVVVKNLDKDVQKKYPKLEENFFMNRID